MLHDHIVVIDLETTGIDRHSDEIIEFAAWRILNGIPIESLTFLVKPRRTIPQKVLKLTGISANEIADASSIEDYRSRILDFLAGAVLVGHNVSFDLAILENNLTIKFHQPVWDTLELARIFFPGFHQYKLSSLVEKLGLEKPADMPYHRAATDAWWAWKVLEACWHKALQFDLSFFDQTVHFLENWQGKSFFDYLKQEIAYSFPDRPIRTDLVLSPSSQGLFAMESPQDIIPDSYSWVKESFSPGGILERTLPGYESRCGQTVMAEKVMYGLSSSQNLVIEAGTGTGKSFAYLIPSLWWSKKTGKKVVVSTHTIPLQEQLHKKDLPLLRQVLPFSFHAVLLKGRGNYICLKKWLNLAQHSEITSEEKLAALSILVWIRETTTGDLQELPQGIGLSRLLSKINAENDACVPVKCTQAGVCFLLRVRHQAEDADLVIINHSLLLSDVKTGNNILPEYEYLVVDEAHHFHQSALEQLGIEISLDRVRRTVERVIRSGVSSLAANNKNYLNHLENIAPLIDWEVFRKYLDQIPGMCELITEQGTELFSLLAWILRNKHSFRLVSSHKTENWWNPLEVQLDNLNGRLTTLGSVLGILSSHLASEDADELDSLRLDLTGTQREVDTIREDFNIAFDLKSSDRVTWLEIEQGERVTIKSSPLIVSEILAERLFSRVQCAVLTSATISVGRLFRHFLREVGLPADTLTVQVDSPFNYDEQMRLFVVKDLLNFQSPDQIIASNIAQFIKDIVQYMNGRTLVLFTSHRLLRETYAPLQNHLESLEINILGQGIDGSRSTILELFMQNPKSVLLGASSFWEGIDIPGNSLTCVIVVKLPFWPPSLPLIEARSELIARDGGNPFQELLLPGAVLRFKQGFGRLIRSKGDRGIVVLLDARVIEKKYGTVFLSSLPVQTHIRGDKGQILRNLAEWLEITTLS